MKKRKLTFARSVVRTLSGVEAERVAGGYVTIVCHSENCTDNCSQWCNPPPPSVNGNCTTAMC